MTARKHGTEDLGQAKRCLGLNIERDRKSKMISINQKDYILELLARFSISEAKCISTPIEVGSKFDCNDKQSIDNVPYQQLIGALMYLAVNSRSDIAFSTSFLSQFNMNHTDQHWKSVKKILRYLKILLIVH